MIRFYELGCGLHSPGDAWAVGIAVWFANGVLCLVAKFFWNVENQQG